MITPRIEDYLEELFLLESTGRNVTVTDLAERLNITKGTVTATVQKLVELEMLDGKSVPCDGKLYYRGVDVEDLIEGFVKDKRFGFEETAYLLLFGSLPNTKDLELFFMKF